MSFSDDFDRALLGPNYISPGRYGALAGWGGTYYEDNVVIREPGIVIQDPSYDTEVGGAVYAGEGEFTSANQFAEITIADTFESLVVDGAVSYDNYAYYGVMLHVPPIADTSGALTALRVWTQGSSYLSSPSTYGPLYIDLMHANSLGNMATSSYNNSSSWEDLGFLDGELSLPVGTKFRIEHVGGVYYGYVFNPRRRVWTSCVTPLANSIPLSDGYPGFIIGSWGEEFVNNAAISQFKAGGDGSTFLTGVSLTAADNTVRGLTRDLTRDLAASSNALIRNIGGEVSVPIVFESGSFIEDFAFNNAQTLDITAPSGIEEGDLLLFFVAISNDATSEANYKPTEATYPFTTISFDSQTTGSDFSCYIMYRIATGSEPAAYSFTKTDVNVLQAWATMYRVSGADQSAPIEADFDLTVTGATATLSADPGAITTTNDGCKLVTAIFNRGNAGQDTASTGMDWITDIGDGKLLIQTGDAGSAGVVDLDTVSWTGGTTNITSLHTFAIIPA